MRLESPPEFVLVKRVVFVLCFVIDRLIIFIVTVMVPGQF